MKSKVSIEKSFLDRILSADENQRDKFRRSMAMGAEKWFKIIEYLILVGLLKIVLEKMTLPDRLFTGFFYIGSYIFWLFYSMDIAFDLLFRLKINTKLSPYIGALVGLFLSYMVGSIATKLSL